MVIWFSANLTKYSYHEVEMDADDNELDEDDNDDEYDEEEEEEVEYHQEKRLPAKCRTCPCHRNVPKVESRSMVVSDEGCSGNGRCSTKLLQAKSLEIPPPPLCHKYQLNHHRDHSLRYVHATLSTTVSDDGHEEKPNVSIKHHHGPHNCSASNKVVQTSSSTALPSDRKAATNSHHGSTITEIVDHGNSSSRRRNQGQTHLTIPWSNPPVWMLCSDSSPIWKAILLPCPCKGFIWVKVSFMGIQSYWQPTSNYEACKPAASDAKKKKNVKLRKHFIHICHIEKIFWYQDQTFEQAFCRVFLAMAK